MLLRTVAVAALICLCSSFPHSSEEYDDSFEKKNPVRVSDQDFHALPKYSYSYGVEDFLTGDMKTARESRRGDTVEGEYSLIEPDGSIRTVKYTSNHAKGFSAAVHKHRGSSVNYDYY